MRIPMGGGLADATVFVCTDDEMPHFRVYPEPIAGPPWELVTPLGSSCALAKCPKCGRLNIGEFCGHCNISRKS